MTNRIRKRGGSVFHSWVQHTSILYDQVRPRRAERGCAEALSLNQSNYSSQVAQPRPCAVSKDMSTLYQHTVAIIRIWQILRVAHQCLVRADEPGCSGRVCSHAVARL
jgi:hypothetical protein